MILFAKIIFILETLSWQVGASIIAVKNVGCCGDAVEDADDIQDVLATLMGEVVKIKWLAVDEDLAADGVARNEHSVLRFNNSKARFVFVAYSNVTVGPPSYL